MYFFFLNGKISGKPKINLKNLIADYLLSKSSIGTNRWKLRGLKKSLHVCVCVPFLAWQTLDLLYRMTNPHNVEVICERLVGYLRSTVDNYLRTDLVARITELAEKYLPTSQTVFLAMNEHCINALSFARTFHELWSSVIAVGPHFR